MVLRDHLQVVVYLLHGFLIQSKLCSLYSNKKRSVIEYQSLFWIRWKKEYRVYFEIFTLTKDFIFYILIRFIGKLYLNGTRHSDFTLDPYFPYLFRTNNSDLQRIHKVKLIILEDDFSLKSSCMQWKNFERISKSLTTINSYLFWTSDKGKICLNIESHPFSESVWYFYCLICGLLGLAF